MLGSMRVLVFAALLTASFSFEALGLVHIEDVRWFPATGTILTRDARQGCSTSLVVLFEAELTAADLDPSRGVFFRIAERDLGEDNDRLFEFQLECVARSRDSNHPPRESEQSWIPVSVVRTLRRTGVLAGLCAGCFDDDQSFGSDRMLVSSWRRAAIVGNGEGALQPVTCAGRSNRR